MEQNKVGSPTQKNVEWDKILAYGTLVFLALVSFNFGGSKWTYILEALGFIVAIGFLGLVPSLYSSIRFLFLFLPSSRLFPISGLGLAFPLFPQA
jgi:hypothetical protein